MNRRNNNYEDAPEAVGHPQTPTALLHRIPHLHRMTYPGPNATCTPDGQTQTTPQDQPRIRGSTVGQFEGRPGSENLLPLLDFFRHYKRPPEFGEHKQNHSVNSGFLLWLMLRTLAYLVTCGPLLVCSVKYGASATNYTFKKIMIR